MPHYSILRTLFKVFFISFQENIFTLLSAKGIRKAYRQVFSRRRKELPLRKRLRPIPRNRIPTQWKAPAAKGNKALPSPASKRIFSPLSSYPPKIRPQNRPRHIRPQWRWRPPSHPDPVSTAKRPAKAAAPPSPHKLPPATAVKLPVCFYKFAISI